MCVHDLLGGSGDFRLSTAILEALSAAGSRIVDGPQNLAAGRAG